ncbi:MAG: hypothetical protein FWC51_00490 [Proteobacteria bacterium]|nr:hypothetical protein [Pseudomonadota bacterium]
MTHPGKQNLINGVGLGLGSLFLGWAAKHGANNDAIIAILAACMAGVAGLASLDSLITSYIMEKKYKIKM